MAERDLLGRVPHSHAEVVTVQGQERLASEEAEPEEWGHGRLGDVLSRPPGDLKIGLLEHVRRVDPPPEPPVDAQANHVPQPLAVPGEQLGQRPLVAHLEAAEQVIIFALVLNAHGRPPLRG
jgi:hypothetical protein